MRYTALTLTPPWGSLIALGAKRIETRGWSTKYRGRLLIHQGVNLKPIGGEYGLIDICRSEPFASALAAGGIEDEQDLPRGAIVASCQLIDIWPAAGGAIGYQFVIPADNRFYTWQISEQERAFGDYAEGRFAWLLADIRRLPVPILARGLPGLWTWEGVIDL